MVRRRRSGQASGVLQAAPVPLALPPVPTVHAEVLGGIPVRGDSGSKAIDEGIETLRKMNREQRPRCRLTRHDPSSSPGGRHSCSPIKGWTAATTNCAPFGTQPWPAVGRYLGSGQPPLSKVRKLLDQARGLAQQKDKSLCATEPSLDCDTYLTDRENFWTTRCERSAEMMRRQLLPEARMEGTRLVISPLTRSGPDRTEKWADRVYDLLPRIHLTQLLEEVDGWTQFTKAFTHLYTGRTSRSEWSADSHLAEATNLGKTRMAATTETYTADRLAWIEDWYIRDNELLLVLWPRSSGYRVRFRWLPMGHGRTSSSDGQASRSPFASPLSHRSTPKDGRDPVTMFYTHVSDRYAPFHTKAISSTVRDATHVLDGY